MFLKLFYNLPPAIKADFGLRASIMRAVLLFCAAFSSIHAQALLMDVDINTIIEKSIELHPLVLSAKSDAEATDEGVTAAKLGRFPSLSVDSGYSKSGMIATVDVQQPLWTAGRLDATVDQATFDSYAARANIESQRYDIALRTIDAWQAFSQSANLRSVYEGSLTELNHFEAMMQRRVAAEVSARIELDLVMNRILQSQDNLQGAVEQQRIALSRIEQLIGEPIAKNVLNKDYDLQAMAARVRSESFNLTDGLLQVVSSEHPAVIKAAYEARAANANAEVEKSAQMPQLYARYRHQYEHDTRTADDTVSVGFQFAPGAGFSSFALTRAAEARVKSIEQSQEAARRQVVEDLQVEYQQFASNRDRESALVAAVDGAKIVRDSYERQFIAGRKSWLDVLNTVREMEQYKAQLAETRASMIASYYKLKLGLGLLPWQRSLTND